MPQVARALDERALRAFAGAGVAAIRGMGLVLAGVGHAIAWVALPVDAANVVAMSIVATALLLVAARVITLRRTSSRA